MLLIVRREPAELGTERLSQSQPCLSDWQRDDDQNMSDSGPPVGTKSSLIQQDLDVLSSKPSVQQLRQKFTATEPTDNVAYARRVRSAHSLYIHALASPAMGHWGKCPPPSTSS